jgi:hypothetical protein
VERAQRSNLIEGNAGPFYVAMNRATFYLCSGIFIATAPVVIYLMHDAPSGWRYTIEAGTAVEVGTLLHIAVDRIYGWPPSAAWAVHAGAAVAVFVPMLVFLH